jgi:hypothetical protein
MRGATGGDGRTGGLLFGTDAGGREHAGLSGL